MRRLMCTVLVISIAGTAQAASFARRVREANKTLASGDAQGALSQYRDLQIDEPESDYLHYGVGSAHYALGLQAAESGALSEAIERFDEAKEAFYSAINSDEADMRHAARFNEANSRAEKAITLYDAVTNGVQLADVKDPGEDTKNAFETAIDGYESFLRDYPGQPEAEANLNHIRYLLKKLLQNPPPPPPEQQQQGGDDEQKQDGEEGEKQDQEKQKQQQQQQEQSGDEQQKSEQNKDQQKQDAGNEQQAPQEQKQSEAENPAEDPGEPSEEERQNIEAILQSLEDMDQQEQEDRRTGPIEARPRKEWW
jgi:hypothetical protein